MNCQLELGFDFPNSGNSEQCRIRQSGQLGFCKKFSLCQSAQNDYYHRRIQPTTCYFDRSDPIVCCTTAAGNIQQSTTTKVPSTNLTTKERISQKSIL